MWESATCTDLEDNQAHLRRIMFDAGSGTSKHHLLLAARAAEQAKWSDTTRHTSTIDTQTGTTRGTSSPAPFTPVV
ncbi:hypothetical protein PISMIDRAFT_686130 [Pisolithus microcarpus 441]|uniref:Uncharacterized protein n=1 Tax=Pisolithus microcarpus 441 TaxID=765257 RepID=A0A0C9Z2N1_9AGAM|nr:hypothetical protein PISMIDRAFT_686130 [Pisolithus microcarpus 441]